MWHYHEKYHVQKLLLCITLYQFVDPVKINLSRYSENQTLNA